MPQLKFIALLGNVDKSILQIELGNGFRIEEWPRERFEDFCKHLIVEDVSFKLENEWGYNHKKQSRRNCVYVIEKEYNDVPEQYRGQHNKELDQWRENSWKQRIFEEAEIGFLDDKITKLRLCAEGSIDLCLHSFHIDDHGEIEPQSGSEESLFCESRLFKIKNREIEKINSFLETPPLKPKQAYIRFALENFLQSYRVAHIELEFIVSMIALETLFNDGNHELRYKISRNCAVLLGKTKDESRCIYKNLKSLYDKRSILVHTGDKSKVAQTDTAQTKDYVRKSLFRIIQLDLSKQDLVERLNESGF